ncbi:beta-galactosidase [Fictibacillus terranigra]|uniref:Beta-galactosidase n=1 Tax=Fictibacillus terranigra TaxID=3058424 RepID=A0ABT8EDL1_9BACL|nr:beta-galactosidase [Fictibacillus sp. CENA-BCM004]MDN4076022.1 beta-galactosidase [Fictibacillus sp. CENA-BCM004]
MIEIRNKQIIIDGKPEIIMCGEIHYFRLDRSDWQDRITKLKEAGCNAVASYIPWICHEAVEGEVDLTGRKRPELDIGGFIDLCNENGLYFFARPGPFIMAEMKNEGIPFWVYEKHPEIIPVTWDGGAIPTRTIDYLAPSFLKETRKWFKNIMGVIEPRLHQHGGNVIAVQLDNEIGMLSWVNNSPDLTDQLLDDFFNWLQQNYEKQQLKLRYPFALMEISARNEQIRSPKEEYAAELIGDLGRYMRHRFSRYVNELRAYSEEFGVKDIPFVINIHGTSGGRALTYPIGISQLYESYTQNPGYLSGSDIYFGDLNMTTFQDLYLINGFMDAVHQEDQPLTSVEFNCGDGNFGTTYSDRYDPSAVDFKIRMCIAQGNRLINFYLFTGGRNYRMDQELNDGNDRIAFTGERHGFAAPVSPEGELNYTYPRMARVTKTMMAVSDKLAVMKEEHDPVAFGFIPDYYMTESHYSESCKMREIIQNLEKNRASGGWEIMARAMLLAGYRFGSTDIQNKPLNPKITPVLALPSARYMNPGIQQKLSDYVREGGGLLLYGEVPVYDMEGKPCTLLADSLGVSPRGTRKDSDHYFLSVTAAGWASPRPEVRSHTAHTYEISEAEPILTVYGTDEVCGFEAMYGQGKAIMIGAAYSCDLPLFTEALERLGAKAGLKHDFKDHGIFLTSTANEDGGRFYHLLNLDGFDKELHLYLEGIPLFGEKKLLLQSKDGLMLPVNMKLNNGVKIVYSTSEITEVTLNKMTFRLTQKEDIIVLEGTPNVVPSSDIHIEERNGQTIVTSRKHAKVDDHLVIHIQESIGGLTKETETAAKSH